MQKIITISFVEYLLCAISPLNSHDKSLISVTSTPFYSNKDSAMKQLAHSHRRMAKPGQDAEVTPFSGASTASPGAWAIFHF